MSVHPTALDHGVEGGQEDQGRPEVTFPACPCLQTQWGPTRPQHIDLPSPVPSTSVLSPPLSWNHNRAAYQVGLWVVGWVEDDAALAPSVLPVLCSLSFEYPKKVW